MSYARMRVLDRVRHDKRAMCGGEERRVQREGIRTDQTVSPV